MRLYYELLHYKQSGRYYYHYVDMWQMISHIGCMLQHCVDSMADVIAKVADGIGTRGWI